MTVLDQKYQRSSDGRVHRAECLLALTTNAEPWDYADFLTASEMAALIARSPLLKACQRCKPHKEERTC